MTACWIHRSAQMRCCATRLLRCGSRRCSSSVRRTAVSRAPASSPPYLGSCTSASRVAVLTSRRAAGSWAVETQCRVFSSFRGGHSHVSAKGAAVSHGVVRVVGCRRDTCCVPKHGRCLLCLLVMTHQRTRNWDPHGMAGQGAAASAMMRARMLRASGTVATRCTHLSSSKASMERTVAS